MLVLYRAAYLATRALLDARTKQLGAMHDKAQRSLSKAERDLNESRSQLQRQRGATIKPGNANAPIVINVDASSPAASVSSVMPMSDHPRRRRDACKSVLNAPNIR
ncbi:MAG: hypothetical protein ACR2MC_00760 [Actinomycetota bacterium]